MLNSYEITSKKLFTEYTQAINTAVNFDKSNNVQEAINFYQKAIEISNQFFLNPTKNQSFADIVKKKNCEVQKRILELQSFMYQNPNQVNYVGQQQPFIYPNQYIKQQPNANNNQYNASNNKIQRNAYDLTKNEDKNMIRIPAHKQDSHLPPHDYDQKTKCINQIKPPNQQEPANPNNQLPNDAGQNVINRISSDSDNDQKKLPKSVRYKPPSSKKHKVTSTKSKTKHTQTAQTTQTTQTKTLPTSLNQAFFNDEEDNNEKELQQSNQIKKAPSTRRKRSTSKSKSSQKVSHSLLSNIIVQRDMYETIRPIGSGSFGTVYLVIDKETKAKYALKEITAPINTKFSEMQLFREIELMNLAQHPLVCKLDGISFLSQYSLGRRPFIVTDYYPNGSLTSAINGNVKFTPTQKMISLYGIALAMRYLHSIKIVHRDLKPDNVLLDKDFYPVVCDFGLSKIMDEPNLTQTSAAGSPIYMAPELMRRLEYNDSVDVYAYAYICFELLTETAAFPQINDVLTLVTKVCNDGLRPPVDHFDDSVVPKKFKKLIKMCWSDDKEKRPSFNKIVDYIEKGKLKLNGMDEDVFNNFVDNYCNV